MARFAGTGGKDVLKGGVGNDVLNGKAGNDVLDGDAGADLMKGGLGNDLFYVDNVNDKVMELVGEGTDKVLSSVSFSLQGAHVEKLTLTGNGDTDGMGNSLANVLTGNSGDNTLNGRGGADHMKGGLGNDTYIVDNAGDTVTELSGQGTDLVQSSVSFSLGGAYVENLTLTGSGNTNGSGNSLNNVLIGNAGNNTLNGGGGADSMTGGAGNDTYYVDNVGDLVIETDGQGSDRIYTSVDYTLDADQSIETLRAHSDDGLNLSGNDSANTVVGGAGDDTLRGGDGNDKLKGAAGDDKLIGGAGDDILTGGDGADVFEMQLFGGNDTITDFDASSDRVDLSIFGLASVGLLLAVSTETDEGVQLGLGVGVELLGVQLADLSLSNFLV